MQTSPAGYSKPSAVFADNVKIYLHEMDASAFHSHLDSYRTDLNFVSTQEAGRVTVENLSPRAPFDSLYRFLVQSGLIVPVARDSQVD